MSNENENEKAHSESAPSMSASMADPDSLSPAEHKELTRKLLWKLDWHVLPPLALMWLANFIDRTNVGNARIAGLEKDLHLKGNQFNTSLAVFYASYLLIELPSNWVLKRATGRLWLPFLAVCWGVVTSLTSVVHSFRGLVAVRVFMGLCEGGMLPGLSLYLSTIYRPDELQFRISIFYASAALSGAFGGLLASAIIKMQNVGGLAGWRWIFVLEGVASVLVGLGAMWFLPASLSTAKFLSEGERRFAVARFRVAHRAGVLAAPAAAAPAPPSPTASVEKTSGEHDVERTSLGGAGVPKNAAYQEKKAVYQEEEAFEWREVRRGLTDVQAWLTGLGMFGLIVTVYSFSLFLPTIVAGLGYKGSSAQLHTVPPFVPAVVLTVVVSYFADKLRWRGIFMLILTPLAIVGYVMAITAKTNEVRYAAVFLMAMGLYPCAPCILAFISVNSSGHYKKATTGALQLALGNTGAFVATYAYTADQAPKYIRGHSIALAFACLTFVSIAANVLYCMWENKARREGRRAGNVAAYQALWDAGKTRAPIGDRSPEFIFSY